MASVEVVGVAPWPPTPELALKLPNLTTAKAAMYMCLASLWVSCAGMAAVYFTRRLSFSVPTVLYALLKISAGAVLFAAVFFVLLLRAMCGMGYGPNAEAEIEARKVSKRGRRDSFII